MHCPITAVFLYFLILLLNPSCMWAFESDAHSTVCERTEALHLEKWVGKHVVSSELIKAPLVNGPDKSGTTLSSIVPFCRLRIRYATTSDWTTLFFENPENILTMRVVSVQGEPGWVQAQAKMFSIKQPLRMAKAKKEVSLTVDFAVSPRVSEEPLVFLLQKGHIGGSTVQIWDLNGDEPLLLQQIAHRAIPGKDSKFNPVSFSLDLSSIKKIEPDQGTFQRIKVKKKIWAFYYPWYRIRDWESPILKDRPKKGYASDSLFAIKSHIELAKSAGIDGFIVSWWGPNDYTDRNLKLLLDLAYKNNFQIMIYYETLKGDNFKHVSDILPRLEYAISQYGSHPAYIRIGDKPVIPVFSSANVPLKIWQDVFTMLRKKGLVALFLAMGYDMGSLEIFDGLHEYIVLTIPHLDEMLRSTGRMIHNYPLLSDSPGPRIWCATVQPGYDDLLVPGRRGYLKNRNKGSAYRATFEAALESNPDWIFITSWNEWWENTHIEPGECFGNEYLRLTKHYADRWKP